MTPKEKAIELINKYFNAIEHKNTSRKLAKKLALITVNEIIEGLPPTLLPEKTEYWKEVKDEINLL